MVNTRLKTFFPLFILLLTVSFLITPASQAASPKDRMIARLPVINTLKDKGVLGEDNLGFLQFRGAEQEKKMVNEENADRRSIYQEIAEKQRVNPTLVGQRRAKQIAQKAKAGHWLQNESGKWYKK